MDDELKRAEACAAEVVVRARAWFDCRVRLEWFALHGMLQNHTLICFRLFVAARMPTPTSITSVCVPDLPLL